MTDASSHPSTTEPMNVTEPIRCGLARAAEGYESGLELEDIAALLYAYDRLIGVAQRPVDSGGMRNAALEEAAQYHDKEAADCRAITAVNQDNQLGIDSAIHAIDHDLAAVEIRALKSSHPTQGGDKGEAARLADELDRLQQIADNTPDGEPDGYSETQAAFDQHIADNLPAILAALRAPQPTTAAYAPTKFSPGDPVEVRLQNEAIDEIVIRRGDVHIEQMSADGWFMGIDASDGSYWQFWFGSKNGKTPVDFRHTETVSAAEQASSVTSTQEKCHYPSCECGDGFHVCPEAPAHSSTQSGGAAK